MCVLDELKYGESRERVAEKESLAEQKRHFSSNTKIKGVVFFVKRGGGRWESGPQPLFIFFLQYFHFGISLPL
jgi:hypothetical protein